MGRYRSLPRRVLGTLRRAVRVAKVQQDSTSRQRQDEWQFSVDSPLQGIVSLRDIVVSGWVVPPEGKVVQGVRVRNNDHLYQVTYGKPRPDVAKWLARGDKYVRNCGFSSKLHIEDGPLAIEVDTGNGYESIYTLQMLYSREPLYASIYNPNLAQNYAEHQNLVENRKAYFYEMPLDGAYQRDPYDPRLMAFYLPQFHPIAENNATWGNGFTEWRNVTTATPRFVGHQQPILPQDLGFYDLRLDDVILEQITLAKKYGIYGFCFYYYWFSGKKLLEHPLEAFLRHGDWDFNFAICWANENWTKRWDGQEQEVIIAQEYTQDDPLRFIQDVEHILLDPRYIREDGKPVLIVYRAKDLDDPKRYTSAWRRYFRDKHQLELQLVSVMGFDAEDPRAYGFDAGLDFAPQTAFFKDKIFAGKKFPFVDISNQLLDKNFSGSVADYRQIATNKKLYDVFEFPTYKSVAPSWDNDARRKGKGFVFYHASPELYATWLDKVLQRETKDHVSPLVFLNAWNEWAESAVLEPTLHSGHAVLNRTGEVLSQYSSNTSNARRWPLYGITRNPNVTLAIHAHIFYEEEWQYIQARLQLLKHTPHDLFITLSLRNIDMISNIRKKFPEARIYTVPNRGRDVLPFCVLARRLDSAGYIHILKLHTKKSMHRADGRIWFEELINNLIPDEDAYKQVQKVCNEGVGVIGPAQHYVSLNRYMGGNLGTVKLLLENIYGRRTSQKVLADTASYGYFASTMFWARLDAIRPILEQYLMPEDFESEKGQIDGTLAHAIERLIGIVPVVSGYGIAEIGRSGAQKLDPASGVDDYRFAP